MDGSAVDNHNRRVYEETLKVIKKAWTEEAWDYNGEYYKVPYPYAAQLRRLLPLFRRLWLRGSFSSAGGRREISTPHHAASVRVDRGSLSQSQIRPSRDGRSGQTRDRSAEDARRRG